jgi:hypothetical protein
LDIEEEISEVQLNQTLASASIRINDGAQVFLEDDELLLRCRLLISHSAGAKGFKMTGDKPTPYVPKENHGEDGDDTNGHADDDIVMGGAEEEIKKVEADAKSSKESSSGTKLSGSKRTIDAVDLTEDDEYIDKSGKRQKTIDIDIID